MSSFPGFFKRIDWPNHMMAFISTLLGVWLAIYLGNSNEHHQEVSRMKIALASVKQEIQNNNRKAGNHIAHLDSLLKAVTIFSKMIDEEMELVATERQMNDFLNTYSWFLSVGDKRLQKDSFYIYDANLNLNLQLMTVSDIAWENTKLMDVLHLIDTQTAFQLHGVYRLQDEAQRSLNEAMDIIKNLFQNNQDSDAVTHTIINDLKGQMQFAYNMEMALQLNYDAILANLEQ
ncbi:MAG: hypothetical protein R2824_04085 [Saprospiraceae bacterium]|nr:hypothetical protein [Lewinella sp.]